MKILMVSIYSSHFFNWTEQLKDSGHEIFWFDVTGSDQHAEQIDFVHQFTSWRYRWNYPGRYRVKRKHPKLYQFINLFNEKNIEKAFDRCLEEVKPDVVQSFAMHLSCFPIFDIMNKFPNIKWVYSSWGSDLFFYKDFEKEVKKIKQVLSRLDYMFTDCNRDYEIANELGFRGKFLGVYPGGGGSDFKKSDSLITPFKLRNTLIIKGYEGKQGRCIYVLKGIISLKNELKDFNIVIFAANREVKQFIQQSSLSDWRNIQVYGKIPHIEVMRLMGESLIYVGNSMSDGMPNTLLESIVMGVFPIQSNPGGATSELIASGENGFLINDPEDPAEIGELISSAINAPAYLKKAVNYNTAFIKPYLERNHIKKEVLKQYEFIQQQLKG